MFFDTRAEVAVARAYNSSAGGVPLRINAPGEQVLMPGELLARGLLFVAWVLSLSVSPNRVVARV